MSYLASVDLIAVDQAGNRVPVTFRLEAPEKVSSEEWRCRVSLDGLKDGLDFIHGADSMQALSLALRLAVSLLRDFIARGGRLLYAREQNEPLDESEWPLESYFGWLGGSPRGT